MLSRLVGGLHKLMYTLDPCDLLHLQSIAGPVWQWKLLVENYADFSNRMRIIRGIYWTC